MSKHPFYGKEIYRDREEKYIKRLLKKYRKEPATEELKEKIWNELMWEKHLGNITIPFKVVIRKDSSNQYPEIVEVILDTKV
ncbi:putative uncharacterized protein [Waddlia chondrophila 2032/99]|uniref:Uncharacterized protein n=1 Tax=Waddlia chondrophila 2032/99 TaxID=765953 RepID=F8LCN0_9BACT|nr:putative uncharacterized protein [Waddlia chondrophila 2032/99]